MSELAHVDILLLFGLACQIVSDQLAQLLDFELIESVLFLFLLEDQQFFLFLQFLLFVLCIDCPYALLPHLLVLPPLLLHNPDFLLEVNNHFRSYCLNRPSILSPFLTAGQFVLQLFDLFLLSDILFMVFTQYSL